MLRTLLPFWPPLCLWLIDHRSCYLKSPTRSRYDWDCRLYTVATSLMSIQNVEFWVVSFHRIRAVFFFANWQMMFSSLILRIGVLLTLSRCDRQISFHLLRLSTSLVAHLQPVRLALQFMENLTHFQERYLTLQISVPDSVPWV